MFQSAHSSQPQADRTRRVVDRLAASSGYTHRCAPRTIYSDSRESDGPTIRFCPTRLGK